MEQGTGIEPAFTAWEAVVLPIYEPCRNDWGYYSREKQKFQALFVGFLLFYLPAKIGRGRKSSLRRQFYFSSRTFFGGKE